MSTQLPVQQAERLQAIVADFADRVKELWAFSQTQPELSLADLECKARQLAADCFAAPLQFALEQQRRQAEDIARLASQPCACGNAWHNKGTQSRTIITFLGELVLERSYYYCELCRQGYYPLDEALALDGTHFSDAVQQAVSLLGAELSFAPAADTLLSLSGISVSVREAERLTEARGAALEQACQAEQQQVLAGGAAAAALLHRWQQAQAQRPVAAGSWAVALDAAKALFVDGWHEIKAGVVFRALPYPLKGGRKGEWDGATATAQSYIAEVGDIAAAASRLSLEVMRRGIGADERIICLGDGAAGNWNQFALQFPRRVEVLDWYHAVEHLWAAGNGMYGQGSKEAKEWVSEREKELWKGQVAGVVGVLQALEALGGVIGAAAGEQVHYFETNQERMHYAEYRAAGYPIGSGTVESTCKRLIGARIKGAGMRWSKLGAQAVLTLRAELLSGRWEQAWLQTRPAAKVA